jgi:hypothetical protein
VEGEFMKKIYIFIFTILSLISLSNSKIITSNQVSYTLGKNLVKGTDIDVVNVFDAYADMFNQKISFSNLDNKQDILGKADAVISFSHNLEEDYIFEAARRYNIRVVDLDLSYSYREDSSLVLNEKLDDRGNQLKFNWVDYSNIYKMIDILKLDLSDLYPKYTSVFEKNSIELKDKFMNDYNDFMEYVLDKKLDIAVIQIGNSELDYLLDSLEIYHYNIDLNPSLNILKKTMEETGVNKFVSYRALSKDTIKMIESLGGKYVKLSLANIPSDTDDDDLVDEDGFIYILKDNLEKLKLLLGGK